MISSGKNKLWLEMASDGSKYGSVNWPGTPNLGNDVNDIGTSLGLRCFLARFRLLPMSAKSDQNASFTPIAHIALYRQEIRYRTGVRGARGGFKHVSTVFRMKFGNGNACNIEVSGSRLLVTSTSTSLDNRQIYRRQ